MSSEIVLRDPPRQKLNAFRDPNEKLPIWDIIKKNIGKDLTKVVMPAILNEPLCAIQSNAETCLIGADLME